jgi:holin-like protein
MFICRVAAQIILLFGLTAISNMISHYFHLLIPGNVLGMLILFFLLFTGVVPLKAVEETGAFLLRHMIFFFLPITAGVMGSISLFWSHGLPLFVMLVGGAIVTLVVTGWTGQFLLVYKKKGEKSKNVSNDTIPGRNARSLP